MSGRGGMMDISIEYCVVWNYEPRAAGLAAELDQEFRTSTSLIKGANGVFEVIVDGDLVFSKKSLGRFPDDGEVAAIIRGRS